VSTEGLLGEVQRCGDLDLNCVIDCEDVQFHALVDMRYERVGGTIMGECTGPR
jgi:hypothetical protein